MTPKQSPATTLPLLLPLLLLLLGIHRGTCENTETCFEGPAGAEEAGRWYPDTNEVLRTGDSIADLDAIVEAAADLADGGKLRTLPAEALGSISRRLGPLVPYRAAWFAGQEGPVRGSSETRREGRHALALSPVAAGCAASCGDAHARALCDGTLPEPAALWEELFARPEGGYVPERRWPINAAMVTFVNYFHDDSFRTQQGTNGSLQWTPKDPLTMSQVYGDSAEREAALRTFSGGRMRTSTAPSAGGGEEMPPLLSDVRATHPDFEMWTPTAGPLPGSGFAAADNDTLSQFYAVGDPRFNMHPGHLFWATLALRLHNRMAALVASQRPGLGDQEVFERARLLVFHLVMKVRTEEFVSDSISPFRDHARVPYDPDVLRQLAEFRTDSTPPFVEFNLLYRWHALVPDGLVLDDGGTMPFADTMWNPGAFNLSSGGLAPLTRALRRTPMGRYGALNTPSFLRRATEQAIADGRAQRLRSYNEYRRFFRAPPLTDFAQFGLPTAAEAAARRLYNDSVDAVDFFVGIQLETQGRVRGNVFGDLQLLMVALFALQDLVSLDVVKLPELWDEELLTPLGKRFVQEFSLADLVAEAAAADGGGEGDVLCPFMADDGAAHCTPVPDMRQPGGTGLALDNACDFVGRSGDFLIDWIWRTTPHYTLDTLAGILLSLAAGAPVLFATRLAAQPRVDAHAARTAAAAQSGAGKKGRYNRDVYLALATLVSLNALYFTVMVVPASVAVFTVVYAATPDVAWRDHVSMVIATFAGVVALFAGEAAVRALFRTRALMLAHHSLTTVLATVALVSRDVFALKMAMLLVVFVYFEAPVFVLLALHRLRAVSPRAMLRFVFPACMALYLASRVAEVVLVGHLIGCASGRMMDAGGDKPAIYASMSASAVALLAMQFYVAVTIFRMRASFAAAAASAPAPPAAGLDGDDCVGGGGGGRKADVELQASTEMETPRIGPDE